MAVITRHQIVSFGIFEVDLDAEEIRKAGLRVRLAAQPFRLLAALLARPGDVLTREELQHEIWGDNTNVDFERGLASAINKVREALGDSADHPTYIETIARKGYRFIAPIAVKPREAGDPETDSALKAMEAEPAFPLPFSPDLAVLPHSVLGYACAHARFAHNLAGSRGSLAGSHYRSRDMANHAGGLVARPAAAHRAAHTDERHLPGATQSGDNAFAGNGRAEALRAHPGRRTLATNVGGRQRSLPAAHCAASQPEHGRDLGHFSGRFPAAGAQRYES
jgi:DNA-binding winged helix-turn-helix (wHTH) protein